METITYNSAQAAIDGSREDTEKTTKAIRGIAQETVPRIVFDVTTARLFKLLKWALIIIAVMGIIIGGLGGYVIYDRLGYDVEEVTLDSQDEGNASYIGSSGIINNGDGEVTNVEGDSQKAEEEEPQESEG